MIVINYQNTGLDAFTRPAGPCRPTHPLLVLVHDPLYSVLSSWNPNCWGKSSFARDTI
jgi:hypothetical protein